MFVTSDAKYDAIGPYAAAHELGAIVVNGNHQAPAG
jgi:hypothetical protein